MAKHTCCYVLTPATAGTPAVYCGDPTRYKMVLDDDGNRVRSYDSLCQHHRAEREACIACDGEDEDCKDCNGTGVRPT